MGEMFSERKLVRHDISVDVFGDAAVAEFYWDFAANFERMTPIPHTARNAGLSQGTWGLAPGTRHYPACPSQTNAKAFEVNLLIRSVGFRRGDGPFEFCKS